MADEEIGVDEMNDHDEHVLRTLVKIYGTDTIEAAVKQIADEMNLD